MSTIKREIKIKDCGTTYCDPLAGCKGHVITVEFQNTVDVGNVFIDGEHQFGGGDALLLAVADGINDLWSDSPKYAKKG